MKSLFRAVLLGTLVSMPAVSALAAGSMSPMSPMSPAAMMPGSPPKGGFRPQPSSGNPTVDRCNNQAAQRGLMYGARMRYMKSCLDKAMAAKPM